MCGIAGIFKLNEQPDINIAKKMADAQLHRGPNGQSLFAAQNIAVAFNRLSIIDLSEKGNHPQTQGKWKVWLNGCIYNYRELRHTLKKYQFQSTGDTEVIAALIDKLGVEAAVKQLNGMFAICAYNEETHDTYIIRDRYGIKPLYYTHKNGSILFASEIKALLEHPDVSVIVNKNALGQWMRFQNIFNDETIFAGIYKLEKGTIWHLNENEYTKYWRWKFDDPICDVDYAISRTRDLLITAIDRQKRSDAPAGAWCSGGLDSSIISMRANLPLFTAGFTEPEFDERKYAETVSASIHPSVNHYEMLINSGSIYDYLNRTIYHLEDLRVGPSYSNYALYELTGKYVRVCLQGTGGDELFAGYNWRYTEPDYSNIIDRTKINLLNYEFDFPVHVGDNVYRRYEFDAENFLEGVLLVGDKLSMAHGIEDRVPFLDNDLVDFVTRIPAAFKQNKDLLKAAAADLLPESILQRKKWGFTSPDSVWLFQNNEAYFRQNELQASDYMYAFIDIDSIDTAFKTKNTNAVWCLIAFQEWCEIFLGGKKPV